MGRIRIFLPLAGVLALVHTGCRDTMAPQDESNDRIAIVNNAAALAARVTYYDQDVQIAGDGVGYPAFAAGDPATGVQAVPPPRTAAFKLMLKAEVVPPSVDGQMLQATSVTIVDDRAVVSYAMRGSQYLGGVDVFDIHNKNKPLLTSQALFRNTDVNAVSTYGDLVIAAEATGDAGFASPAVVELMQLSGGNLVLNGAWRLPLSSYAATCAVVAGNRAYATSGDGGSLFVFDPYTSAQVKTIPLHDARWVAAAGGLAVVVQGTPGRLAVFNATTMAPVGVFPFAGGDVPESKSTVAIAGGKAFIAAGPAGVQVLNASTGVVVGSVARPDPAALALDPAVVVTNAVAVDENLLFIANGEAGVYVAQGSQNFTDSGSASTQQITMLGRLQFGNLQSVNHVAYKDRYLIIAAGLGGLKIVQVI